MIQLYAKFGLKNKTATTTNRNLIPLLNNMEKPFTIFIIRDQNEAV